MPCEDFSILRPVDAQQEGCPVVTKTRSVIMQRGLETPTIEWVVRDRLGNAVDLKDCVCEDEEAESDLEGDCGSINVRFQDIFGCSNILQAAGTVEDQETGVIRFEVPPVIANTSAIYKMSIGVLDSEDKVRYMNEGLLSVERSLFGFSETDDSPEGPLTLNEIRMELRDTMLENRLLDQEEFSDAEILHAMSQPIREWNEMPPPVGTYTPYNFPFRYHWLQATVGNLLRIAAGHYLRNDLQASAGGVNMNDQDKVRGYTSLAQERLAEWKNFLITKKVSINAHNAFGSLHSPYYGYYGW